MESSPAWVGRRVASDCRGIFWLEPRRKGEDRGGRKEAVTRGGDLLTPFASLPPSFSSGVAFSLSVLFSPLPSFLSSQVATFRCCLRAAHTEERRGDRSSIFCGAKGGGDTKSEQTEDPPAPGKVTVLLSLRSKGGETV